MKTISLPIYNRPDALKRMLETLKANNTEGWTLVVSQDGYNVKCQEQVNQIDWMDVSYFDALNGLGLTLNTFLAPSLAFAAGSDFNLYLEDDLLLSPDALDLCNWYAEYVAERTSDFYDSRNVGLTFWRAYGETDYPELASPTGQGGHGNGFACTRYQWETFWRKEWFGYGAEGPGQQWDIHTDNRLRELGKTVLSPLYPRSKQQKVDGTHGKSTDVNPLFDVPIYEGERVKEWRVV